MVLPALLVAVSQNQKPSAPSLDAFLKKVASAQGSQFSRLFPHPTGKNGLEEYVLATDLMGTLQATKYELRLYDMTRGPGGNSGNSLPPGLSANDSYSKVEETYRDRFKRVVALIERGNSKPFKPLSRTSLSAPELALETAQDFPLYASFRQIVKYFGHSIDADFAEHRADAAVTLMTESLKFSERVSTGSVIATDTGYTGEVDTFSVIGKHLQEIPPSGAKQLREVAKKELASAPREISALRDSEAKDSMAIDSLLAGPTSVAKDPSAINQLQLTSQGKKMLSSLSKSELKALAGKIKVEIHATYAATIASLSGPKPRWSAAAFPANGRDGALKTALVSKYSTINELPNFVALVERRRQRYQLLILNMQAIQYRAAHGAFPDRLDQFTSSQDRIDPFNSTGYLYQRRNQIFVLTTRAAGTARVLQLGRGPEQRKQPGMSARTNAVS